MKFLDSIPWWILALAAVAFAVVPVGESHFVQKWRMLFSGELRRAIDWFDLVMHSAPLALLIVKLIRSPAFWGR